MLPDWLKPNRAAITYISTKLGITRESVDTTWSDISKALNTEQEIYPSVDFIIGWISNDIYYSGGNMLPFTTDEAGQMMVALESITEGEGFTKEYKDRAFNLRRKVFKIFYKEDEYDGGES